MGDGSCSLAKLSRFRPQARLLPFEFRACGCVAQARDSRRLLRLREGVELLAHCIDGGPARCLQGGNVGNVGLNLREFKIDRTQCADEL